MNNMKKFGAIVLAAGKGKRMNSKTINKVMIALGGKPMILYIIELLRELKIDPIMVVVGFAKQGIISLLQGQVIFAEQKKRLGTGHAVLCALQKLPPSIENVLVLNGDDSAFYTKKTIEDLIEIHFSSKSALTFLTIVLSNPYGLGRVVRDERGEVVAVIEEKDATDEQRKIKEANTACYVFRVDFLKRYLGQVKKSKVTGEYYLVDLIRIARESNERIETLQGKDISWRGVNTPAELQEAEQIFQHLKI